MRFLIARDLSVGGTGDPGHLVFCSPEKRCLSRRRTCKHLTHASQNHFSSSETAAMSKRTREKKRKAQSLEQLAKPDEISLGRRFAQPYAEARLQIDHPHSLPRMEHRWPL
jgi:hypothetical protein